MPPPFHFAFPVHDLDEARSFYGGLLRCEQGRSAETWVDFNLFGHQIVAHLAARPDVGGQDSAGDSLHHNPVDGHDVPVPHFGVVLPWDHWHRLAAQLRDAGVQFVIEPGIRFSGETGEQATMFFLDPSGNALEFKAMKHPEQLFAS